MERPLVIYHANCLDGFGAAFAAFCNFRQGDDCPCDFVAASYGQHPPEVTGRDVYIVDYSYRCQVLQKLCRKARAVTVIDHHITAERDLAGLEQLLVHFSQLVAEQRWIKELDINPLLASPQGLLALDARVVIHEGDDETTLPRLAIRPYPAQYEAPWVMKDGSPVLIRPIRAEDEHLMYDFHASLSERTVAMRYLSAFGLDERVTHERLARMTHNDYDREIALVAEGEQDGRKSILGVARLSKLHGTEDEARFTMLVSDAFQGRGLGREMLQRILQVGRDEKIKQIIALMSPDNEVMQKLFREMGFTSFELDPENNMIKTVIDL